MKITVKVTQEDIDSALPLVRKHANVDCYCPVALALKRDFPGEIVTVGPGVADISKNRFRADSEEDYAVMRKFTGILETEWTARCKPASFTLRKILN